MHPSLETKQVIHEGYTCVLTTPETFFCVLEVSIREQGGGVNPAESSSKEEAAAGLAGGDNPLFYRNIACVT